MSNVTALVLELVWLIGIYILVSLAVNLVIGHAGLFSLATVGFFALGALGTTLAVGTVVPSPGVIDLGLGTLAGILLGIGLAAGAAVLIGIPALRLRGDYFAIATLGFGEALRILLKAYEPFTLGVNPVRQVTFLRIDALGLHGSTLPYLPVQIGPMFAGLAELEVWVVLLLAAIAFLLLRRLRRSAWGRTLRAVRDDDRAAEALGKNTAAVRLQALVLSAIIASVAGSLYVQHVTDFRPDDFGVSFSILFLLMAILGGLGSDQGAVVGAVIIAGLDFVFQFFVNVDQLAAQNPATVGALTQALPGLGGGLKLLLLSIVLLALMLLRPAGLLGGGTDRRIARSIRRILRFLRVRIVRPASAGREGRRP